ncbi:MAG: hypothetical protein HRT67_12380 [Flavobacteriaceae bacterium]|nr:hypothetical protein [Flavobacteriaceae bacterium]
MTKKQKNILLIFGFIFALYICYKLAISKTFEQKSQYDTLSKEVKLSKNGSKQLSLLKQKEVYYNALLKKYEFDGSSIQNNLLKIITTFSEANNIKVIHFLEPHVVSRNDIRVKTYEFTLEGKYSNINQLIYQLEQRTKFGEIINLHFEKKKNFRTNKYYLQARVLLKNSG